MSKQMKIAYVVLVLLLISLIAVLLFRIRQESKDTINNSTESIEIDDYVDLDSSVEQYLTTDIAIEDIEEATSTDSTDNYKIGHVSINGTSINYDLMYSTDLMYYTKHNDKNNPSEEGAIFLDSRIEDFNNRVLLIHGQTTEDDKMFSLLFEYSDEDYGMANSDLLLTLEKDNLKAKLFAVIEYSDEEPIVYLNCNTDETFKAFYNKLLDEASYSLDSSYSFDKRIIILNTVNSNREHILVCFMEE